MKKTSYSIAIRLLTRRPYSTQQIREKLIAKQFAKEEVEQTIEELKEKKFIDDSEFFKMRIRSLIRKSYGPFYIEQKLMEEGIRVDGKFIEAVYNEMNTCPEDQVKKILEKQLRIAGQIDPTDWQQSQKIINKVRLKGHTISMIQRVFKNCEFKTTEAMQ